MCAGSRNARPSCTSWDARPRTTRRRVRRCRHQSRSENGIPKGCGIPPEEPHPSLDLCRGCVTNTCRSMTMSMTSSPDTRSATGSSRIVCGRGRAGGMVGHRRRSPAPDHRAAHDVLRLSDPPTGTAGGIDLQPGRGDDGEDVAVADGQVLGIGGPGSAAPQHPVFLAGAQPTTPLRFGRRPGRERVSRLGGSVPDGRMERRSPGHRDGNAELLRELLPQSPIWPE